MGAAIRIVRAVRRMCAWCRGGRVQSLECLDCPLAGCDDGADAAALLARIRAFCLACAGSPEEVAACAAGAAVGVHEPCALHPFRLGRALRLRQLRFLAEQPFHPDGQLLGTAGQGRPGKVQQVRGGKETEKEEHGPQFAAHSREDANEKGVLHG